MDEIYNKKYKSLDRRNCDTKIQTHRGQKRFESQTGIHYLIFYEIDTSYWSIHFLPPTRVVQLIQTNSSGLVSRFVEQAIAQSNNMYFCPSNQYTNSVAGL